MKGWMIAALVALTGLSGSLNAEGPLNGSDGSCCAPCERPCQKECRGTWELQGQALYWRICISNNVYAFVRQTVPLISVDDFFHTIGVNNEWGFRIKSKYTTCDGCTFASLSYLYFDERDRASVSAPGNVRNSYFGDLVDTAIGRITSEYQRLNGHVGRYACKGCKGAFYGYGGISWIYFRNHERVEGFLGNQAPFVDQRSRYSAAGFEAGVGGHYNVCGGFGLATELGGVAAIGKRTTALDALTTTTIGAIRSHIPGDTVCVSGLDVKLEAFYECCWCGYNWGLMVGYEQHYYFSPFFDHPITHGFLPDSGELSYRTRDFGVGGLYFGAKVGY